MASTSRMASSSIRCTSRCGRCRPRSRPSSSTPPADSGTRAEREQSANALGGRLFAAAMVIPIVTLALVLGAPHLRLGDTLLIDPAHVSLIALGTACTLALIVAIAITRARPQQ